MRHLILITTLVITATALAAAPAVAGGGGGGSICRGFADSGTITMLDSCFEGTAHTVEPGTAVTVVNGGEFPHTFTAADGSFDSGIIEPGDSWTMTFEDAGAIPVYCTLHGSSVGEGMAGAVFVGGALGTAVASAATAGTPLTAATGTPLPATAAETSGWWPSATVALGLLSLALLAAVVRGRRPAAERDREPQLV